ncbi:MAG: hypothetical protein KGI97_07860 [Alphaproteobacteria bacterium]|nr:hypothetical protein [Alphaproteobacteria bacterium]
MSEPIPMSDRGLTVKLATVIGVKILLLAGIWFLFFRGNYVGVDAASMGRHIQSSSFLHSD